VETRIFDEDPIGGRRRLFHYDHTNDTFTIETQQDVTDLVEQNKALAGRFDERSRWAGDWHRVASIPMSLYFDLKRKGLVDDIPALKRWLNDPDNRFFRTRPGRV
jgi:hypothetical protein